MTAEPFVHPALFYRDETSYLEGTVPFIRAGLAAGEPVAVSVPGPQLKLIEEALGADDARRIRLMDMTAVGRNPGRIIPNVLRAFADAHPDKPVRIIGEPIWAGRSADEYPACVQHEALINHAFTGRDATILCPYDVERLDPQVVTDAYATHPVVIGGETRPSDRYAPDAVVAAYNAELPAPPPGEAMEYDAERLPDVRHQAVGLARALGLRDMRLIDFELAVAELTTNSVVHGGGAGSLRLWDSDGDLICEVRDAGRITDPLVGRRPTAPDQLGGRGLLLVNTVADLVRMHHGPHGTTVRAYFGM